MFFFHLIDIFNILQSKNTLKIGVSKFSEIKKRQHRCGRFNIIKG